LLHHILQRDKAGFVLFQALLHLRNGLVDGCSVLAYRSLLGFGMDEAVSQNGRYQRKGLLALRLCTQDSPNDLTFASPLPVTMILRGPHVCADLFPGRANTICLEVIRVGPKEGEGTILHFATGIE
jgi:hypothetical protein